MRPGFKVSSIKREYCEAQRISLKAFGNWRAKFKVELQPPSPKLLYRRHGLATRKQGLTRRPCGGTVNR